MKNIISLFKLAIISDRFSKFFILMYLCNLLITSQNQVRLFMFLILEKSWNLFIVIFCAKKRKLKTIDSNKFIFNLKTIELYFLQFSIAILSIFRRWKGHITLQNLKFLWVDPFHLVRIILQGSWRILLAIPISFPHYLA